MENRHWEGAVVDDVLCGAPFSELQKCPKDGRNSTCPGEGLLAQRKNARFLPISHGGFSLSPSFNPQIVLLQALHAGRSQALRDKADTIPSLGLHRTHIHILS